MSTALIHSHSSNTCVATKRHHHTCGSADHAERHQWRYLVSADCYGLAWVKAVLPWSRTSSGSIMLEHGQETAMTGKSVIWTMKRGKKKGRQRKGCEKTWVPDTTELSTWKVPSKITWYQRPTGGGESADVNFVLTGLMSVLSQAGADNYKPSCQLPK